MGTVGSLYICSGQGYGYEYHSLDMALRKSPLVARSARAHWECLQADPCREPLRCSIGIRCSLAGIRDQYNLADLCNSSDSTSDVYWSLRAFAISTAPGTDMARRSRFSRRERHCGWFCTLRRLYSGGSWSFTNIRFGFLKISVIGQEVRFSNDS